MISLRQRLCGATKHSTASRQINVQPFVDGDVIYGVDQSGNLMAVWCRAASGLWETIGTHQSRRGRVNSGTAFIVQAG